ncbi:HPr family phosphocarrier protein [Bacillus sp. USDA818B3_A]|uniref:HPr family phosphocarrier protein n=1 Tax=Bacillus sp. USDA818B3_A TaxID=2698834 RepID=UPI0013682188|nr:HPr family phosphocarrier protein [Bacillus sp. USDA818B3_A]
MIQETLKIKNKAGLYAQPVNQIVKAASQFNSDIFLTHNGRTVNVKSVLGILSLAIPKQAEITLEVSGEDEIEAFKELIDTFKQFEG